MCNHNQSHSSYHNMKGRHPRFRNRPSGFPDKWARMKAFQDEFFFPPVKVAEQDDHYVIKLQVPGYQKEDFNIGISANIMTVKSEGKQKDEGIGDAFYAKAFKRQFELNEKIDQDSIKAEYSDGILTILLDKKETFHTQTKEIEVV